MRKDVLYLFVIPIITMTLFITTQGLQAGEKIKANWSVREVKKAFKSKISGGIAELRAGPESNILEIKGLFRSRGSGMVSGQTQSVKLIIPSTKKARKLAGLGLVGKNGECSYMIFQGVSFTGQITMTLKETGDGFDVKRKKEDEPYTFILKKNPCRLCLAFVVPKKDKSGFRLRFIDTTFRIPAPGP